MCIKPEVALEQGGSILHRCPSKCTIWEKVLGPGVKSRPEKGKLHL